MLIGYMRVLSLFKVDVSKLSKPMSARSWGGDQSPSESGTNLPIARYKVA
jgi:hypothetical protein